MSATMDVGIVCLVKLRQSVDDAQRLLGGSTVVKPYQVVAVHLLMEHWKLVAYLVGVDHIGFLVMQILHQFRLRYAYAETVLAKHRLSIAESHIVALLSCCYFQRVWERRLIRF